MVFEHIDKLKEEYTDKFVTVDVGRPELKRFDGLVGRVKTVNMSGRALVEFDTWINNIGWYDIDIDFLKVVDESEVAEKTAQVKAAPKKADATPSQLEKSRESAGKPAAKTGGGMSMADILAAARGGAAPAAKEAKPAAKETKPAAPKAEPAKSSGGKLSVEDMLAAARASASGDATPAPEKKTESKKEAAPAPAAAKDPKSMSVADMLAAARSADSGAGAPATESSPPPKDAPPAAAEKPAAAPQSKKTSGFDTSGMTVEQMLALARDQASGKAPPAQEKAPAAKEEAEAPAEESPAAVEPEPEPEPTPAAASPGELPKDIAGIIAFCQQADG